MRRSDRPTFQDVNPNLKRPPKAIMKRHEEMMDAGYISMTYHVHFGVQVSCRAHVACADCKFNMESKDQYSSNLYKYSECLQNAKRIYEWYIAKNLHPELFI